MNHCIKLPHKLKPNGLDCSYSDFFLQNNPEDDCRGKIDSSTSITSDYN